MQMSRQLGFPSIQNLLLFFYIAIPYVVDDE